MPSSIDRIPSRTATVKNQFPSTSAKGISKTEVTALTSKLVSAVVTAIKDAEKTGATSVNAELILKGETWDASWGQKPKGTLHPAKLSSDELRAALGQVVNKLLEQGYYNIVFQVVDGHATGMFDAFSSNRQETVLEWQDQLRISFSRLGERRFDVDFDTSNLLRREDTRLWTNLRPHRVEGVDPKDAWDGYLKGRERILRNANGMPY